MNYASINCFSPALNRHVTYNVILPTDEAGPGPFPVLYQLHGLTDDAHAWTRNSNLVRHAARWPMLIVMPDGGTSFYMNHGRSARYEDFMTQDLPASVARTFHVRPGRAAIGGLSMGGYGAIRLALRHPELYGTVWAHSSALLTGAEAVERYGWAAERAAQLDIFEVARPALAAFRAAGIRLTLDCGTEDFLIGHNRRFAKFLREENVVHDYREHPGAHEWDTWDRHVPAALAQHAEVFGVKALG